MSDTCTVCNSPMEYTALAQGAKYGVRCPRCGDYTITNMALAMTRQASLTSRQRANCSGWLRQNQPFDITSTNWEALTRTRTPSFHERADMLLVGLARKTEFAGQDLPLADDWISCSWCLNSLELDEVLAFLRETQRLVQIDMSPSFKIAPAGWAHLEAMRTKGADSQQGFVAMWFDDAMKPVYDNAIARAIEDAGFKAHRVDQREHNDRIDDEIIAQIRSSRFVVADFTGHRGGVYYEAGFAKGLGLEVFWTCRKDDIDKLHFDIRQYNCIDWTPDKLEDFRKRLANRIESVLGRGRTAS